MLKVSVIIPAYNCANYISEAVESVLKQTDKDFEILVVDDGSTDNTKAILTKFNGKIRYFYQNNKGVAAARNLGIRQANGDYIAFLDGDDAWLSDKLSLQLAIIERNPDIAMIFTDGESFDEKGVLKPSLMYHQTVPANDEFKNKILLMKFNDETQLKEIFCEDLIISNRVFTSSVLVRKKCLQETGGFDESLNGSEDYDLWLRMSYKYPILYFNRVTARYRVNNAGLSGDFNFRFFRYNEWNGSMLRLHLKICNPGKQRLIKKRIVQSYNIAAWGFLNINELKKVRQLCLSSLTYDITQVKLYLYFAISFLPVKLVSLLRQTKSKQCKKSA